MTQEELFTLIETRIGQVTERERQVLTLRFGLDDGKVRSLEEVAEIMGITRERVRQIENKVLRRPVHLTRAKKIKDFYN